VLWGCAHAPAQTTPAVQKDAAGVVSVSVQAVGADSDLHALLPGSTLRSGERFAVAVSSSRPVFVYVGQRAAVGPVELIYPPSDPQIPSADPSRMLQLPAGGQWFQLDEKVGDETLYVLASTQRLDVSAARQQLLSRTESDVVRTREPPPVLTERNRGEWIQAALAADGIARLSFPLKHR
jgi:hypothetical protein